MTYQLNHDIDVVCAIWRLSVCDVKIMSSDLFNLPNFRARTLEFTNLSVTSPVSMVSVVYVLVLDSYLS